MDLAETRLQMGHCWLLFFSLHPSQTQRCPHSQMMLTLLAWQISQLRLLLVLAEISALLMKWLSLSLLTPSNLLWYLLHIDLRGWQTKRQDTARMENPSRIFCSATFSIFACQNELSFYSTASALSLPPTMNSGSKMNRCSLMEYPMTPKRASLCAAFSLQVRLPESVILFLLCAKTILLCLYSERMYSSILQSFISPTTSLSVTGSRNQNLPPVSPSLTAPISLPKYSQLLRCLTNRLYVSSSSLYSVISGKKTCAFLPEALIFQKSIRLPFSMVCWHMFCRLAFLATYSSLSSFFWRQKQARQPMANAPTQISVPSLFSMPNNNRNHIATIGRLGWDMDLCRNGYQVDDG